MKLTIEIETITPEIAQVWLEKNTNNRTIRQMVVDRYADEMCSGAWKLNAETIKFSRDGTLLDGQHRLWAVVESKVTIQSFVARGISADALQTIDSVYAWIKRGRGMAALSRTEWAFALGAWPQPGGEG